MSVDIAFPLEFVVLGTPVSLQGKRAGARAAWKQRVKHASSTSLPEGHFATDLPIAITLLYFPGGEMRGDIDNIVKPILDALSQHIYRDDRQVERIWVQKFESETVFPIDSTSVPLRSALHGGKPALFVRVGVNPNEGSI